MLLAIKETGKFFGGKLAEKIAMEALVGGFQFIMDNVRGKYYTDLKLHAPHAIFFRMFIIQKYRTDLSELGGRVEGALHSPTLETESLSEYMVFTFENTKFVLVLSDPDKQGYRTARLISATTNKPLFHRLMKEYTAWTRTRYRDNIMIPKLDQNDGSVSWICTTEIYPQLDQIPMHSRVRASIDDFIQKRKATWNGDNPNTIGLLLFGNKGTGKTNIAKAIASELDTFIYEYRDVKDKQALPEVQTNRADKTTMLFDEVDTITGFQVRKDIALSTGITTGDMLRFFNRIEGKSYCVVGTTNFPDRIDDAFKRHGRFSIELEIPNVDDAGLKRFIRQHHPELDLSGITFPEYNTSDIYMVFDSLYDEEDRIQALRDGYITFGDKRIPLTSKK